jgi:signal transduction histidine kinase
MGKDGLFFLPMVAYQQYIGVLVLAIDEVHVSNLADQGRVLTMLANQAALAMHAHYMRKTQKKIVQEERLTASSDIVRKVVHEVISPVSIIKNYLKILELKLPKKNLPQEEIRILNEEIDRLGLIVRELSDFSEPTVERPELLDLNALLSDTVKLTRDSHFLDSDINVHLNLDPGLPMTVSEKNSLKQIFINLMKNAGEAMSRGGNLHISTRHMANQFVGKAPQRGEEEPGFLEINISDDGPGIPETIKARLFEPFTSTKGEGHSGLGLSIVHSITKKLGGTISCTSDRKSGTRFKIQLPIRGV